jgi:hypothetical protein
MLYVQQSMIPETRVRTRSGKHNDGRKCSFRNSGIPRICEFDRMLGAIQLQFLLADLQQTSRFHLLVQPTRVMNVITAMEGHAEGESN